ncbi:MAG TPA: hypothetical protein VFQ86_03155 [Arachidicoccus soli]|jgi:hypothetical protein|uniref:Uncharacterized protein n=1 Tax=Arachidicoccus soli TaxID=2341117 RepID=A0A386HSN9_9BACT|nr:hypothetical protein [Arachidicoccus soli]AYD48823.1 hypothetical protein D6B99_15120 [Arachidicoccus soli]HEU0226709.1 hypothetical protein [Arachidicoccus soli]
MQSFIVNIPDDKVAFFVELIEQLDFELLEIEEQHSSTLNNSFEEKQKVSEEEDPFLDWEAELKNAKKKK